MTTSSQTNGSATDLRSKTANDWVFQGNNTTEILYDDNFEADISALEDEGGANDSGYFSSENLESTEDKTLDSEEKKVSSVCSTGTLQRDCFSTDTFTSIKVDYRTTYNRVENESTEIVPKGTSYVSQSLKSSKRGIIYDFDTPSVTGYSRFSDEIISPTSLQTWVSTHERHESIAYRLEQPAKKRKTATGRQ
jgi:hypothetical protein